MKDRCTSKGKKTGGQWRGEKGTGKGSGSLLGTQKDTLNFWECGKNLVTTHETAEASQVLVKVGLVKKTGSGTRNDGMTSNLSLKMAAPLVVCGCVLSVVKRTHLAHSVLTELTLEQR